MCQRIDDCMPIFILKGLRGKGFLGCLLSIIGLMCPLSPVLAAIVPGTINPARAAEAISEELKSQSETGLQPTTEVFGKPGQAALSPEMAKLKFNLKKFNILFSTPCQCPIFSEQELIAPFLNKIGQVITLGELQAIATQMTTRYQQAGYVLTKVIIPPQNIQEGVVTLQVIEGYIDKIEISGHVSPCLEEFLRDYGEQIRCSVPLQMKTLERYTLLASDIHGLNLKVVLKPSAVTPGAADLVFVVEQSWGNAFVAVNNYGTRFLGPLQVLSGVEWDSVFRAGDVNQVQVASTVNKELNFIELRRSEWLNCDGLKGSLSGQFLRTEPGSLLAPFDVRGNYDLITSEFAYPIIRARKENFVVNGGFSVLDSESKLLGRQIYFDHIRPVFLGVLYNRQDKFKGISQAEFTITQGFNILGASGFTNISRPNGHSTFTKLNSILRRTQTITQAFSLYAMVEGQYTLQPLLVPMQFGFGGSVIGRGYDPSELIGNQGVAGVLEARYQVPRFARDIRVESYIFYDAGKVWNPRRHDSATSTGIGFRGYLSHGGELDLYVAKPLTHDVFAYHDRRVRVFCSLVVRM